MPFSFAPNLSKEWTSFSEGRAVLHLGEVGAVLELRSSLGAFSHLAKDGTVILLVTCSSFGGGETFSLFKKSQ